MHDAFMPLVCFATARKYEPHLVNAHGVGVGEVAHSGSCNFSGPPCRMGCRKERPSAAPAAVVAVASMTVGTGFKVRASFQRQCPDPWRSHSHMDQHEARVHDADYMTLRSCLCTHA